MLRAVTVVALHRVVPGVVPGHQARVHFHFLLPGQGEEASGLGKGSLGILVVYTLGVGHMVSMYKL